VTELLVSVRDAAEAQAAVRGGASIIDVKEPNHGPLGFAGIQCVREVLRSVKESAPVSVALGEATDWLSDNATSCSPLHGERNGGQIGGPTFTKLGLSGLRQDDWQEQWVAARRACDSIFAHGCNSWVAVAYADFEEADCPSPERVLEAAINSDCRVFLIDTFNKSSVGTLECLGAHELSRLRQIATSHNLLFALAGQLKAPELSAARLVNPDIVAVRGAVCSQQNRRASVQQQCVAEFVAAMKQAGLEVRPRRSIIPARGAGF